MQATRLRMLARCLALAAVTFASCADKDDDLGPSESQSGRENEGGSAAGEGGSEGAVKATAAGSGPRGGDGASAGSAAVSGHGGVSGDAGEGNSPGCERPPAEGYYSVELDLCPRLDRVAQRARDLALTFEKALYGDCRVRWLTRLYTKPVPHRDDYLNDLLVFNRNFWGCQTPVDQFLLVWESPPLSQGDLQIVVDHYVTASTAELALSEREQCEMRVALERLGQALVVASSEEPSQPECVEPGSGGAGGLDAGGTGAGGEPQAEGGAGGDAAQGGTGHAGFGDVGGAADSGGSTG